MPGFHQKNTRHIKRQKPELKETNQSSLPGPVMAGILELSEQELNYD